MALRALDGKTYHFTVPTTSMDEEALLRPRFKKSKKN